MKYKKLLILAAVLVLLPATTLAAGSGYETLINIPGVNPDDDFGGYINSLYKLAIALAALLAVIKIIIAGMKWMMTDIVTSKQEAKEDIWGATMGLLLIISSVLLLGIINKSLTNFDFFNVNTGGSMSGSVPTYPDKPPLLPTQSMSAMRNDQANEQICASMPGNPSWYNGGNYLTNGGPSQAYCVRNTDIQGGPDFIGCTQLPGSTTAYNCDAAKSSCQNDFGGTPADALSVMDTVIPYKIACKYPS